MSQKYSSKLLNCALFFLTLLLQSPSPSFANPKNLDLSQYEGKVIYVDFWASWCGPCRKSFPWMNQLQSQYKDEEVVILAINVDSDPAEAQKFLQQNPAHFKVLYDPKGEIAEQFQVEAMPSTYLFNRDGVVKYLHRGFRKGDEEKLQSYINQLLKP